MYHSQIRICETYIKCSSHIYIEHRNPEIRKTRNDFLVQVRNLLLPLSLKVLRERYRFFLFWLFHLPPPILCGSSSAQIRLASASPESRPFSFGVSFSTQLTDFFKIAKILRALPMCDVTRTH